MRKRRGRVFKDPDLRQREFAMARRPSREEVQGQKGRRRSPQAGRQSALRKRPMGLHLRRRQGGGPLRHEGPARRQGRQPRRDGEPRPAGAARLHHHHRSLHRTTTPTTSNYPKDLEKQVDAALGAHRARSPARQFGDRDNPLLVSVRSGARASMPGMMDTVLNLGLNDETVEALAQQIRRPALRLRFLPPLHPDVFRRGARRRAPQCSRTFWRTTRTRAATRSTPSSPPTTGSTWSTRYKERVERGAGQAVPAGPARAALGRDRRGVRLVDERARHHLSPPARHSRKLGHRGQRAGHGVRQHGRRPRRPASPSRAIRRPARSGSTANSWSTRRARTWSPASARRRRSPRSRARRPAPTSRRWRSAMPAAFTELDAHLRHAREALPRHAGHRVHHRARQALDAADAHRQAHREGRAAASPSRWPTRG